MPSLKSIGKLAQQGLGKLGDVAEGVGGAVMDAASPQKPDQRLVDAQRLFQTLAYERKMPDVALKYVQSLGLSKKDYLKVISQPIDRNVEIAAAASIDPTAGKNPFGFLGKGAQTEAQAARFAEMEAARAGMQKPVKNPFDDVQFANESKRGAAANADRMLLRTNPAAYLAKHGVDDISPRTPLTVEETNSAIDEVYKQMRILDYNSNPNSLVNKQLYKRLLQLIEHQNGFLMSGGQ